jgi:gluconate 2-dehydrogenase gamma chain
MDRRLFLLSAAAAPLYAGPLVLFSDSDAKVVQALCGQIVPTDDAPGAAEAGVVFYIDKQLAGPLKGFAPEYRRGIPQLQAFCRERTGREFLSLSFAEQTALLRELERAAPSELKSFFAMVVDHTMQGYYGSPEHGGNRDEASWRMLQIVDVMGGHQH